MEVKENNDKTFTFILSRKEAVDVTKLLSDVQRLIGENETEVLISFTGGETWIKNFAQLNDYLYRKVLLGEP